jgi:hypothetical protein
MGLMSKMEMCVDWDWEAKKRTIPRPIPDAPPAGVLALEICLWVALRRHKERQTGDDDASLSDSHIAAASTVPRVL